MQRGSIEHEQIIYESSNRRMKQLMDWLSNSHWTPDTGMLTYLLSKRLKNANFYAFFRVTMLKNAYFKIS